jgi:hypothetical protein
MYRQTPVLATIALFTLAVGLRADLPARTKEASSPLTATQKAAALRFAQEHHPQLGSLIRRLEKRDPAEFERALTDVSKTYERLSRLKPRDPQRYDVDLALWKTDSRIRLLAARMANDQRSALELQLRSLLSARTDLRLQQLALERQRLTARIEKLDDQTSQLSSEREDLIDKELERLRRSVRTRTSGDRRQQARKTSPKPRPEQPATNVSQSPEAASNTNAEPGR